MCSVETTSHYQKYRKEWETEEEFKTWLRPVANDPTKAFYTFCHCEMFARIADTKKHKETKKHRNKCNLQKLNLSVFRH